jgi:hypothetical protein
LSGTLTACFVTPYKLHLRQDVHRAARRCQRHAYHVLSIRTCCICVRPCAERPEVVRDTHNTFHSCLHAASVPGRPLISFKLSGIRKACFTAAFVLLQILHEITSCSFVLRSFSVLFNFVIAAMQSVALDEAEQPSGPFALLPRRLLSHPSTPLNGDHLPNYVLKHFLLVLCKNYALPPMPDLAAQSSSNQPARSQAILRRGQVSRAVQALRPTELAFQAKTFCRTSSQDMQSQLAPRQCLQSLQSNLTKKFSTHPRALLPAPLVFTPPCSTNYAHIGSQTRYTPC